MSKSQREKTNELLSQLTEGQVIGPVTLIEDAQWVVTDSKMTEGVLEGKQQTFLEVQGRFQHADMKNHNNRLYPRGLWEKTLSDKGTKESLERGAMHGHLDHPEDGKTLVEKVSHIVTSLKLDESGEVVGRARVLNNQWGNQLKSIFEAGGTVGISSRGSGSVKMVNGVNVVQEDFKLNTFDFVVVPSTPNAFPKPIGERTVAVGQQLRNENQEEESMSASLTKLAELKNEVSVLLTAQPEKLNEGGRSKYVQDLDAAEYKVNKLVAEDAGVGSLTQGILGDIATKRKAVQKLNESDGFLGMASPPMITNTIQTRVNEQKCACGFPGCECRAGVCECYNKMMGFMEGKEDFEEFDLDAFLDDLDTEGEQVEETEEEPENISVLRQARIHARIAEADRNASGQVISALANRIRDFIKLGNDSKFDTEMVKENADLKAENEKLKGLLVKVNETVKNAEPVAVAESLTEDALGAAIDSIITQEPKAKLWASRLLKAKSLAELRSINEAAKAEILTEKPADPTLPPKGTSKKVVAVDTDRVINEGAALSQRILSSMKSKKQNISRAGQILESASNVK